MARHLPHHGRHPASRIAVGESAAGDGHGRQARLICQQSQRLSGQTLTDETQDMDRYANNLLDTEYGGCARSVLDFKMKFLEMMDDDFNTAGAIGTLHTLAGAINGFIEQTGAEKDKPADVRQNHIHHHHPRQNSRPDIKRPRPRCQNRGQ